MNYNTFAQAALFISLLVPAMVLADLSNVSVVVSNLSPAIGTVEVSLFDSAESFLKEPHIQQSGPAGEDGTFQTDFVGVPEGEYAVVVVHDANDDGKLDSGFLGFGGEGYGFSNNAKSSFGRPGFEDAKITVDQPLTVVEIDFD